MMSHTTSMRWLTALLLLIVLAIGSFASGVAQEENVGTATATATVVPTPASEVEISVSIGDEPAAVIATEDPAQVSAPVSTEEEPITETPIPETETPSSEEQEQTPQDPGVGIGATEQPGVPTGDGSPVASGSSTETPTEEVTATPTPTATPDETVEAASVGVSVTIYLCDVGYAGGDPSADADCSPANGIDVTAEADSVSLGVKTTDGSGTVSFDAPEGSQITFSEVQSTLPSGYVPDGNGTVSVTAKSGASATIVNIEVQTAGRLQISNGQCPTSGDPRTQFIVVGPLAVQASGLGCEPHGGTSLTVTGPGGAYSVVTDASGNWVGTLPVGTYTISNANGSEELDVETGATTIVLVVDYVPGPKGILTIQRFDCTEGSEGTIITIDGGPNNDSCLPSNETVSVAAAGGDAAPLAIELGDDGATSIDVAAGDYVVTDGPTGTSANVQVDEGSSVTATINSTILTGVVSANLFWCDSSVSGSVNPTAPGNWTNACGQAGAGIQVALLDSSGEVVSTASTGTSGSISFSSVMPGRYALSSSDGCALFANGADARNGFDIVAGATVQLAVFGCEEPASIPAPEEPAEPEPAPGSIGGGPVGSGPGDYGSVGGDVASGYGGAPLANPEMHTRYLVGNPLASVSTLPSTGEGTNGFSGQLLLAALALAALSAGGALALSGERRKRTF